LSFIYSGVIFVLKELYVIALIILLCNTFNWFKVVMPTPPQAPIANKIQYPIISVRLVLIVLPLMR